jgi:F0F1-type ATP synthase assembly protein I
MNRKKNPLQMVAMVGSMGMEVILLTFGGAWLGKKLDAVWGTKPLFLLLGFFLGLALGFVGAGLTLRAFLKE